MPNLWSGRVYSIADNAARRQLAEPFSQQVGLPGSGVGVDTSTGSFGTQETDLVSAGNVPLVLTRYYAGHSDRVGEMGYRWRHSYDTRLALNADGDAVVLFADGAEESFDWSAGTATFAPADGRVTSTLVKGTGTNWVYTYKTRFETIYRFTQGLQLYEVVDPNGNTLTLNYDGNGRLSTVTAPGSRTLTFTYSSTTGRLTGVTGPGGMSVAYGYDANGDLTSVTDDDDTTREYAYSRHRLAEVTDANGRVLVEVGLDQYNRVTTLADAGGADLEIAYQTPGAGATEVQDRRDVGTTTYYFDRWGRTTHVEAPTGEVTAFFYDADGNLEAWVDPSGSEYAFTYVDNDLTEITDPLLRTTNITVNSDHRPTLKVDDEGTRRVFEYDGNGNKTREIVDATDPANPTARPYLNLTTDYVWDGQGRVEAVIVDPDDGPVSGTHLHLVTAYGYNAAGQVTTVTVDPTDPSRAGTEPNLVTEFVYDAQGELTHAIDPGGRTTKYTRTATGRLVLVTVDPANDAENPLSSPWLNLTHHYVYDLAGNLIIAQDPEQYNADPNYTTKIGTEWYYDLEEQPGLVTRKYDAEDVLTRYEWDADGRMTRAIVDALPESPASPTGQELRLRTDYVYDASGRLSQTIVDPDDPNLTGTELNLVTAYTYDTDGLLETVVVDAGDPDVADDGLELTTTY